MRVLADFQWFWNPSGKWVVFWGAFGSCLGMFFGWMSGLAVAYRRINCHHHRCWRVGRFHLDGSPYTLCKVHHPAVPEKVTMEHIVEIHARQKAA